MIRVTVNPYRILSKLVALLAYRCNSQLHLLALETETLMPEDCSKEFLFSGYRTLKLRPTFSTDVHHDPFFKVRPPFQI